MKSNIILLNDLRKTRGGPATFQRHFTNNLGDLFNISFNRKEFTRIDNILVVNISKQLLFIIRQRFLGARIILRLGTPEFYLVDLPFFHYLRVKHFFEIIYLQLLRNLASVIVYQSCDTLNKWNQKGFKPFVNKEVVIYNCSSDSICNVDKPLNSVLRFIVVEGNNDNVKGNFLFYFLDFLANMNYSFELDIFGGYTRRFYDKLSHMPNIKFHGYVDTEYLRDFYPVSDFAIFTDNKSAACPNSVLEFLSNGIPVIAHSDGVICEIINNKCGLLVDECIDFTELNNAFEGVLDNYSDYRLCARTKWSDNFTQETFITNYKNILK